MDRDLAERRTPQLPADAAPYKQTTVLYVLEDENEWGVVLCPGVVGVIAPECPHHVEPDADARFFVRFSRK